MAFARLLVFGCMTCSGCSAFVPLSVWRGPVSVRADLGASSALCCSMGGHDAARRSPIPEGLTTAGCSCPSCLPPHVAVFRVPADLSTDGRWCFLVFWVLPRIRGGKSIRWSLLKQRIAASCPSSDPVLLPIIKATPKPKEVYLLQICSADRSGFLNDVTQALWEVELTIQKVNVTTSPDGKAVDLFFVSDNRDELPAKHRIEDICDRVREVLGDPTTQVDCRLAGPVQGTDVITISNAMPVTVEEHLLPDKLREASGPQEEEEESILGPAEKVVSPAMVAIDNSMSPAHSMLQVASRDRKGLIYDCLRTLKDTCCQVAYGRIASNEDGFCHIDMFILDAKGRKITDPKRQQQLCARMKRELERPIRIAVVTKGPDSELLIACPVEECGRGRPRVLYDVTLMLRQLETHVFKADISRHQVHDRQWEVYRFILQDKAGLPISKEKARAYIEGQVRNILMG